MTDNTNTNTNGGDGDSGGRQGCGDMSLPEIEAELGRLGRAGLAAVYEFVARRNRTAVPNGEIEDDQWYFDPNERRSCCPPSNTCETELKAHARTAHHIAAQISHPIPSVTVTRIPSSTYDPTRNQGDAPATPSGSASV
jgi:hypothetical protein